MISDNNQVDAILTQEEKLSFGKQLKTTRESMGLSTQEAAGRLHLSPRFIDLLETGDLFHSSLPPIYLRGYLRSYSRLLNIPEQDVNAILEKLAPTPAILTATTPSPSESLAFSFPLENNSSYPRIATFLVSLLILTSLSTWWYHHSNNTPSSTVVASNQALAPNQNPEYQSIENNSSTPENLAGSLNPKEMTVAANTNNSQPSAAPLNLPLKNQLALAPSASAATQQLSGPTAQPVAPSKPEETAAVDDNNVDEQE